MTVGVTPRIRSYKLRRGRVTASQAGALTRLWPRYGVGALPAAAATPATPNAAAPLPAALGSPIDPNAAASRPAGLGSPSDPPGTLGSAAERALADPDALFGRVAPLVVEIGFGMGEGTAALAARQPDLNVLAVDLHTPGVGSLLRQLEQLESRWGNEEGATAASGAAETPTRGPHVRVVMADAVDVLEALPPASVALVRLFFPDPWPKARHAKRRLVSASFLNLLATRLAAPWAEPTPSPAVPLPGLHIATDWPDYAEHVRAVVAAHPRFEVTAAAPERAPTRFERLAAEAGRTAVDLYAALLPPA